ncbi:hypothetical protein [Sphingomonas sp. 3-13AW]|uniref:hypothetical protein n=1 Tax=Sphingomonas sp. 3-13AW TaxID=3050450 RepID=UPI003BB4DA41
MEIVWEGRPMTLHYSEDDRAFVMYDEDGELYERLDPRGCSDKPAEHNMCWLDSRFVGLLVQHEVVVETGHVCEYGQTAGHLVRIIHPEFHDGGYSRFGNFSRQRLGQQCQYGSRYIDGKIEGYPDLGRGLRFQNMDRSDYHSIRIHRDDMDEFERRYRAYHAARGDQN